MYSIKDDGTIYLYDDIYQGYTAKQVIDSLNVSSGPVTLRINSQGGDVFEAIAVYNLLKTRGNVTVYVDGVCASAASIVAMSGRVIMPSNAMMMIHSPSTGLYGTSKELQDMAELLDRIRDNIAVIYAEKTGLSKEEITAMMESETWFNGTEAKAKGFADEVTGEIQNRAKTYEDGVKAERERMRELDAIMSPGRESMIARAKYDTLQDAKDIALDILRAESRKSDSEKAVNIATVIGDTWSNAVAEIMNKARGYAR